MGSAVADYIFQFPNAATRTTVTISRVYPIPLPGTHTFSLACASNGAVSTMTGGVISYSVYELR
jgi:non-ribosomal peptide synthetase component E (peptide arylation enzyme)